jgi:thiamine-phosphate diphosphorylase/hydroxyethylthiazole kinase
VVAVGGINESNVEEVMKESSPEGIACISAILKAKDPLTASTNLRQLIEKHKVSSHISEEMSSNERDFIQKICNAFYKIRAVRPLIHHITNFVVMNDTANVTLHIGASPGE